MEPFRDQYEETLDQAKRVNVIFKESKSTFRVLKKATKGIEVHQQPDRNEAILRLAFMAARAGFNALIDVEASSEKKRNAGWQLTTWMAKGLPAEINSHELQR